MRSTRPRPRAATLAGVAVLLVVGAGPGCDLPTGLPAWETEWTLPSEGVHVSVDDLLPAGLSVLPDRSAFLLDPVAVEVVWRLRDHCEACALAHGLRVPKPPFEVDLPFAAALPAGVVEVSIVSGRAEIGLVHGLGFDPIRPGAGSLGTLDLELLDSNGAPFVALGLDGRDEGLPSGVAHDRTIEMTPGSLGPTVPGRFRLDSPLGEPARIDGDALFAASVLLTGLRIDRVRVDPGERVFPFDEVIRPGTLSDELLERITAGAITLWVDNGLGAAFLLHLNVSGSSGADFDRMLVVPQGAERVDLTFSGDELRSLLVSDEIRIHGTGRAEDAAEIVLTPDAGLQMESGITVRLRTGSAG